jgi:hypothetical protein
VSTRILDRFQVVVRGCRPPQPDGYELTLEVRRKAVSGKVSGEKGASKPTAPGQPEKEECQSEA